MPEQKFSELMRMHKHPKRVAPESKDEQQPLIPIGIEARNQLRGWGIEEGHIQELREIMSNFRYDLCVDKARRIVKTEAMLYTNEAGEDEVVLPFYYDIRSRLDGECSDIAFQGINMLKLSGWYRRVNESAESKGLSPIIMGLGKGYSETHFNKSKSRHTWIGLLKFGEEDEKMVAVDGSFQRITLLKPKGYILTKFYPNLEGLKAEPLSAVIALGTYQYGIKTGEVFIKRKRNIVLGLSKDRLYAYTITFVKDADCGQILPVLGVINQKGDNVANAVLDKNKEIQWVNEVIGLTPDTYYESEEILSILGELNYVEATDVGSRVRNAVVINRKAVE